MADSSYRYRDRSSSPAGRAAAAATATASKFWPFNRSRSSSPAPPGSPYHQQDYYHAPLYADRSRRSSEQPPQTGSSFVIRSVVKKPGGVSLPSSPDGKPQGSFSAQDQRGPSSSPARRMMIEDSDSDSDNDANAPSKLQYTRSRSKPLPSHTVASLGVPPGGPGGGVGYGTARSFNDGRREPFHGEEAPRPAPQQQRSPSPGNITARGFQQGLQDRGRSPRTSHSPSPGRTDSPSARKPVARITPGPQSHTQTQNQRTDHQLPQEPNRASFSSSTRPQSMAGPRQFPGAPISTQQQPQFSSPVSSPAPHRTLLPTENVFGAQMAGLRKPDSHTAPAFDAGSVSPFGTVSPGGQSPSFLSNYMAEDTSADQPATSDAGGLAGKWLKGVFGRSPTGGDKQSYIADQRSDWARDPRPFEDPAEEEARAQKMESMRQARQIVDAERHQRERQIPQEQSSPVSHQQEFERASAEHEHERRKSPPGRKPIPILSPVESETPQRAQDGLAQLQNRLTPAQQIIHETRSRQLAREQIQAEREAAIRAQTSPLRGPPTPTKDTKPSPRTEDRQQRFPSGAHQIVRQPAQDPGTPSRSAASSSQVLRPKISSSSMRGDMSPGAGPMPLDMPLPQALQEMMERFYRFERYSVPLIRCLETRLQEMERHDGLKRNQQPAEMRIWVGQITNLMKHEIGQLRAATSELQQGRELVADIARRHPAGNMAAPASAGSQQRLDNPRASSPLPTTRAEIAPKTTESPVMTNFGFASESLSREAEREPQREPVQSVSPSSARPRYTSVLGQPLGQSSLVPPPTQTADAGRADDGASNLSASSSEAAFKREVSIENRLKALLDGVGPASTSTSRSASSSVSAKEVDSHDQQAVPNHKQHDVSEREMDLPQNSTEEFSARNTWSSAWQSSHATNTTSPSLGVRQLPTDVPLSKTPSMSSYESSNVAEPVTPIAEHSPALAQETAPLESAHDDKKDSISNSESFSDYASETIKLKSFQYFDTDTLASTLSSTLKTSFDSPAPASPGGHGISPNKLYAKRFPAPASGSPMNSVPSSPTKIFNAALPPVSTTAHLGLVERKRFTLPSPPSPAITGDLVQSNSFLNNNNQHIAASIPNGPTSAAFSTARPIGHHATLKERVAFFDPRA